MTTEFLRNAIIEWTHLAQGLQDSIVRRIPWDFEVPDHCVGANILAMASIIYACKVDDHPLLVNTILNHGCALAGVNLLELKGAGLEDRLGDLILRLRRKVPECLMH